MTVFKKKFLAAGVAIAALALLLTLPAVPASADCGTTVEQGSYDPDSNTFTPGTAATDDDIRITCTESDTDGDDIITLDSIDIDSITLPPGFGTGSYIVVTLNGTAPVSDSTDLSNPWVFMSSGGIQTTGSSVDGVSLYNSESNSLWVEFYGSITTTGDGARGVDVGAWNSDGGSAIAINRGTINTHGGADTSGSSDRGAYGMQASSTAGTATATNYGHIETRGNGANAVNAYTGSNHTSSAMNYGTAIARGGVHIRVIQAGDDASNVGTPETATAVQAYSDGGDARAVNMADGTVEAHGQGSRGVEASTGGYLVTGGTGTAVAENSGVVTSTGDLYEVTDSNNQYYGDIRDPAGVAAFGQSAGEARAVNHAGGKIETTGNGGRGLFAWNGNDGIGDATAINRGSVVTRGDRVITQVRGWWIEANGVRAQSDRGGDATAENSGSVETRGMSAHGVYAAADVGNATAENSGSVDTYGKSARGIFVRSQGAGTATATNSGNVTTHNTETHPDDPFAYAATAIWAESAGGSAESVNQASGSITTKGPRGFGIFAQTQNDGSSTGTSATAVNQGRVTTEADDSDGVMASAWHGGSESNPNTVIARNEAGVSIATEKFPFFAIENCSL